MSADELRFILEWKWRELGLGLDVTEFDDIEALTALIRITDGNFRLVQRLFAQIGRILEINNLRRVSKDFVEAARESWSLARVDLVECGGGAMANELVGQVALVTGGGRGIGRAIAQALATAGAAIAVTARSEDQLRETVALIERAGGRALALPADVTDRQAVEHLVADIERQLGPVDVLVNNAGIVGPLGPLWEADPEAWRRCLDVNLYGAFLCARAVLPGMVARRRGRIINMSTAISIPAPYYTAYMSICAPKLGSRAWLSVWRVR